MSDKDHECDKCNKKPEQPPKFRINFDGFGGVEVEAPSKADCIDLYHEARKQPSKAKIDEAIV